MFQVRKGSTQTEVKTIRMSKKLIERIDRISDENDVSFSNLVIQCLEYAVAKYDRKVEEK